MIPCMHARMYCSCSWRAQSSVRDRRPDRRCVRQAVRSGLPTPEDDDVPRTSTRERDVIPWLRFGRSRDMPLCGLWGQMETGRQGALAARGRQWSRGTPPRPVGSARAGRASQRVSVRHRVSGVPCARALRSVDPWLVDFWTRGRSAQLASSCRATTSDPCIMIHPSPPPWSLSDCCL
jgi:hypothetical protein